MYSAKLSVAVLAGLSLLSTTAFAKPFKSEEVLADSKWVVHVDVDQAREGKLWGPLKERLEKEDGFMNKSDEVTRFTGMNFFKDLNDFTIYGKEAGDDAENIVLIHAKIDRAKTMNSLQLNQSFTSKAVGNHDVLSWDDNGKTNFGAFYDDSTVIIGHEEDRVEAALATLDDKTKGVKSDSPLVAAAKEKQILYVGVRDFPSLAKQNTSPIVQNVDSGWIALDENADGLLMTAKLLTKDADTAKQESTLLSGLVAMVGLAGGGQNADPKPAMLNDVLKSLSIKQNDAAVDLKCPMSAELVTKMIDMRQ